MKKILLLSFLTYFSVLGTFAQSLELYAKDGAKVNNGDTIVSVSTNSTADLVVGMNVTNSGSADLNVMAKKTELSIVSGSENYFCWVSCYMPNIFVSPNPLAIVINDTIKIFSADYSSNGNVGASFIRYTFFSEKNINDSIAFVVKFIAGSGVGIDDAKPSIEISNLYPNPATNSVSIKYDLNGVNNAQLEIRNVLGSLVKKVSVNESNGLLSVDVSDLTNGVYFYSFIVNNEIIKSKKLIIQR